MLLDLPLGRVRDAGLEWHSQLHQVDSRGAPDDNVWALVGDGNVLGEVVQPGRSAVICICDGRWPLQNSKVTARTSSCLAV